MSESTSGVKPETEALMRAFAPWLLDCLADPEPKRSDPGIVTAPTCDVLRRCPHGTTVERCEWCWKGFLEGLGHMAQYEVATAKPKRMSKEAK